MTKANILSIQLRPKIGQKQKNLEKASELIEKNLSKVANSPDLILLPEFFNTGISVPEFKKLAETPQKNETVDFFAKIAQKHNTYILCGSIIETDGKNLYNTSTLIDRKGKIVAKYRKIHLFDSFGGTEDQYCTRGDKEIVVDTDFGKIGMSVCFDIRFPKHFLNLVKQGAQIIVEPAAWCAPNQYFQINKEQWQLMNKARALDNMVYFCSSNLCGKVDSFLSACGSSMICAPNGEVLAQADEDEGAIGACIDTGFLEMLRSQFNMPKLTE